MKIPRKKQSAHHHSLFSASLPLRRALNLAVLAVLYPSFSYANPNGAQIVSGQVSIDTATPGVTTVTNSPNAIINWQNFSIAQHELTQFIQQNGQSAVLNRIIGQNPSEILGQLTSNGKVFLINPNGVVFGAGSVVDTQGLIASSLNLSDQDFLSGNYHFMAGSSAGNVINEGIIRAGKDGNVILIAPHIENNGIISSDGGSITLAAGHELTITNLDNPEIRFQIQAPADSVVNLGKLLTEGGVINVFAGTIKHSGDINADSVEIDAQGNIRLVAQQDITLAAGSKISANNSQGDAGTIHIDSQTGTTLAQGTIKAKATQTGKGGSIELLGEHVGVLDQAKIDAGGQNGGGQVLIGGDYQGKNPNIHNAKTTYASKDTTIKADAKSNGNGGKVIIWSNDNTRVDGDISAKGGSQGGNGGFIETSGAHIKIADSALISTLAPYGKTGTWLIDPHNFTIASGGGDITGTLLSSMLVSNSVTISTATGTNTSTNLYATTSGDGDIFVNDSIAKTGATPTTLTLAAERRIIVDAPIGATDGKLNVTLQARATDGVGNVWIKNNITTNGGNLVVGGGSNLTTGYAVGYNAAGSVDQRYGVYIRNATISTGTGNITIRGQGVDNASGDADGIDLWDSTAILQTTTGNISLTGQAGNTPTSDSSGVYIGGTVQSLTGGNVTVTGTGGNTSSSSVINRGVYVDSGTVSTSGIGTLSITGTGGQGATGTYNAGIKTYDSTLSSATGALTLFGTSGNGTDYNKGIYLDTTDITTSGGTLSITGISQGTGTNNYGIETYYANLTSGSGALTLNGTGGNGTNWNEGVYLEQTDLTTASGALSITGIGQGSGTDNYGINTYYATLTSNSGGLTLDGTGGNGTNWNEGVYLEQTDLTATNGALSITGTGQGSGTDNYGIETYYANLTSGSGDLTLNGTGGNGTNINEGVYLEQTDLTTANGALSITGTGQGSGTDNYGIKTLNVTLDSGSGAITFDGLGAGAAAGLSFNSGTVIGAATGQTGDITLIADTATGSDSIIMTGATAPKIQSGGTLTLKPLNNATTIGLAGGTGTFNLSATELGYIQNSFSNIIIGNSTGTGLIYLGTSGWTVPSLSNLTLQNTGASSSNINLNGALTLDNSKILTLNTKGMITNNAPISSGIVNLLASTGITQNADITAYHNITLTANGNSGTGNFTQNAGTITNTDTVNPGNITINAYDIQVGATASKHNVALNAAHDIKIISQSFLGGGTAQNFHADDSSFTYTLPFGFTYYGVAYNTMYVSSNGIITFGGGTSRYTNSTVGLIAGDTGLPMIAPAWSDWVTYSNLGKDIYIHQPSANTLAIRWDVANFGNNSYSADFETVLTQQGDIAFNYGAATAMNPSYTATIGVSKGDNVHYTLSTLDNPASLNNLSSALFSYDITSGNYLETLGSNVGGNITAVNDISLVAAGALNINNPITATSIYGQGASDITLSSLGTLTSSGTGNAIVLNSGSGNFSNYAGVTALSNTGGGRWLVYSTSPTLNTFGGLTSGNSDLWSKTYANYAPANVVETGNRYLFSRIDPIAAQAAADAAAKAAADAAAAKAAADEAAAKAAADEAAAKAAADEAAAKAAADAAAAKAAADEAAAKAAADAAADAAAAKAAADAAAAQAEADAKAKAEADAKAAANAVPNLLDGKPPTPVEVTLTNSLGQVTSVVTTTQSGQPLTNALQSNTEKTSNTDTTGSSTDSSAAKGKNSKQCTK
ncbi:MAG TPA: filamentous hemagglutinin N-terminal domain-containing protein [Methylobacter sp.]|jgi:filamentous hemagglutinin family protein